MVTVTKLCPGTCSDFVVADDLGGVVGVGVVVGIVEIWIEIDVVDELVPGLADLLFDLLEVIEPVGLAGLETGTTVVVTVSVVVVVEAAPVT
jgi:hypothetical protein